MHSKYLVSLIFVILLEFVLPDKVEAQCLGTWGETVFNVGTISAKENQNKENYMVGYKFSYAGLFWIDLWTWGGEYCVYEHTLWSGYKVKKIINKTDAAMLMGKNESDIKPPLLFRWPLGLVLSVSLIGFGLLGTYFDPPKTNSNPVSTT